MAEKKKKTWWEYLAELFEAQGPIRYQGSYDAGDPYAMYRDREQYQQAPLPVMFQPTTTTTTVQAPTEEVPIKYKSPVEEPITPEQTPVQKDLEELWKQDKFNRFYFSQKQGGTSGGVGDEKAGAKGDPYGVKKKGYENHKPRGEVGSDVWWYDMSRIYDSWGSELQQQWQKTYGTPRQGDPYQVFPYWKYDNAYKATGGSNKRTMFNSRTPQQPENRGLTRDKWGRWNTPGGTPGPDLSANRVGNQMVTWRR